MLHFFRKMRKALIPESRFGRYFFYALGEIVLVVIGILLALQINIWNQERKNRNEEKTILSNLNNEFRENKKLIAEQIELFGQFDIACKKLMSLMNKTPEELSKINVDKIIYESIEHQKFNPSNAILSELFQVGKLGLITDQQLKNKLFEWTREIERNNSSYQLYEKWTEEQVILYYSKNIALKNIDMYSPMGWKEKSKFESGTYGIFNDREYENILDNELYHIALLTDEYKNIEEIIDVIISRTKSEK